MVPVNQSFGSEFILSKTSTDAGTSGWRMVNVGARVHWAYVSEDKLLYRNITSAGQVSNPQTIGLGVRTASLSAVNATDSTFRLIFSYVTTPTAENPNQLSIAETNRRTTVVRIRLCRRTRPEEASLMRYLTTTARTQE